jgi:polysaccharide biosynthesis transport protein
MAKDERLIPLPNVSDLPVQTSDTVAAYSPMYDDDAFGAKRSFREYASVFLKRKWMILTLVTTATVLTALYVYRLPSTYQSQAQIEIKPQMPKPSDKGVNINFGLDQFYRETRMKLIQNPQVMRDVVINLGLYRDPNFLNEKAGPGLLTAIRNIFVGESAAPGPTPSPSLPMVKTDNQDSIQSPALTPDEEKRVDLYSKVLVAGLAVEPVERTNLVNVKFTHNNPDLAADIANGVATAFINRDIQVDNRSFTQTSKEVQNQIEKLQPEIAQLEQERINYLRENDLPLGDKSDLNAQVLTTLANQALTAQSELRTAQYDYEAALRAKSKGLGYIYKGGESAQTIRDEGRKRLFAVDDEAKRLQEVLEKSRVEIQREQTILTELQVKYTDEYPAVIAQKEKIAQLQRAFSEQQTDIESRVEKEAAKVKKESAQYENKTLDEIIGSLQAQFEAASKRSSQVNAEYARKRTEANQQGQAAVRLTTLNQEIDTKRRNLDSLYQQQTQQQLAVLSSRPDNITIQMLAQKPASLIGPQRTRLISIAFLLSLAAGMGIAYLLDYLDDSIKSSDDIGRHLGLPTLALIPHLSLERRPMGKITSGNPTAALMTLENNRSIFAEAYRHLRTSLLFSSAGKPPQTMLVTSSQPSEGKTTTVINTAVTLAQAGAEVVVVDCDLRRPRLHHHFQMDNTHGITNYLSGERNVNELLKPLEALPNLKVITSGPLPPNPAELLSSTDMRDLLAFLRSNFKHVIVDSPPALSFTDAAILSTLVDGVIIVAMTGKSSINLTRRFKKRLQDIGARIYGVVLTGLKRHSVDYGYGYGYGYNYYYSYGEGAPQEEKAKVETEV